MKMKYKMKYKTEIGSKTGINTRWILHASLVSHMHEYAIFKNSKQEDAEKKLCNEG